MVTPGQMQMFNKPEPYESQILGSRYDSQYEYVPFLNIDNAGTYIIRLHDHTLGNALRMQLLRDKDVLFSGYRIPHPLEPEMHLRIQTVMTSKRPSGEVYFPKPQAVLHKANKLIMEGAEHLATEFRNEMARIGLDLKEDHICQGRGLHRAAGGTMDDDDDFGFGGPGSPGGPPKSKHPDDEDGFYSGLQTEEQETGFKRFLETAQDKKEDPTAQAAAFLNMDQEYLGGGYPRAGGGLLGAGGLGESVDPYGAAAFGRGGHLPPAHDESVDRGLAGTAGVMAGGLGASVLGASAFAQSAQSARAAGAESSASSAEGDRAGARASVPMEIEDGDF